MRKRSRQTAAPEITPLIDVVFLLLIFFMVSTVFKKEDLALVLNLPKTTGEVTKQEKDKTMTVELSNEKLAINGKTTTLEEAEGILAAITTKETPVDLRVDKEVKYERIVRVLDILKNKNFQNISLVTER